MEHYNALRYISLTFMNRKPSNSSQIDQTRDLLSTGERTLFAAPEGAKMLQNSGFKTSFFTLAQNFEPQRDRFCCGIATAVIVLNSLAGRNEYSQTKILDKVSLGIKPLEAVLHKDGGLTLSELSQLLRSVGAIAKTIVCERHEENALTTFKSDLMRCLSTANQFVVANFDSALLVGSGSGHFSPLGAFDQSTQSVLVMDTGRHRTPWYWVSIEKLYRAMNTTDGESWRGYLIVQSETPEAIAKNRI